MNTLLRVFAAACIAILPALTFAQDQNPNRKITNVQFARGEKLTYNAHMGMFNAAEATVYLHDDLYEVNERPCYRVDINAASKGMFGATMHIRDTWRSYIDTSSIIPQKFFRNIEEGKYRRKETVYFDHKTKLATVKETTNGNPEKKKDYKIPACVQDIVSGYYYLRTLDLAKLKEGQSFFVDGFVEDSVYHLEVKYVGKEVVKTDFGKINAIVLSPVMPKNSLFDGKNSIKIWISDDANRVPLRIKAKMFVGAVEIVLSEYSGLKHKFNLAS